MSNIPILRLLFGLRNSISKNIQIKRAFIPILILVFIMAPLLSIQPTVTASAANLSIISSTQTLFAGTNNQVNFTIKNTGDNLATQVFVSLSLPTSATGESLMILNGSDGKYYIETLSPGQSYTIYANIYVSPSAAGGTYQIVFTSSYQSDSTSKTDTRIIGVNVPTLNVIGAFLSASISPYELVIGQNNLLTLKLQNIGDADATSVTISLTMPGAATGSSPLSLINSDGRWTYDVITQNSTVLIPLTVYASPSASGQTFQATLTLSYSDYIKSRTDSKYLTLSVPFSTSPAVNLEVGIAPQYLRAGEINTLNITITNIGDSDATYVQAVLTMPPSGVSGLPMVLQQSDGRWFFNTIIANSTINILADVYVSPSASGIAYQTSLTLSYYDSLGRAKQDIRYFGLIAKGFPDIVVLDTSTFPVNVTRGNTFSLTVTVINLGTATAQSVIILPNGTADLQPVSTDKLFIGDLPVDVPSSFTLSYIAGNISSFAYLLNLAFNYTDSLGQKQIGHLAIPLALTIATNASTSTDQSNQQPLLDIIMFYLPIIAIIAVVIIVAYFYMRHRRSR
jgi:hypothetical protein